MYRQPLVDLTRICQIEGMICWRVPPDWQTRLILALFVIFVIWAVLWEWNKRKEK